MQHPLLESEPAAAAGRAVSPCPTSARPRHRTRSRLDRRSARSRDSLRDALAAEIEATGDLSRVTVTAVTERAGLTRRTFYSHFHDIPDLVEQTEREALADIKRLVENIAASHLSLLVERLDSLEPAPGAVELLAYFRDNTGHLTALLGQGGDPAFVEKIKTVCTDAVCGRALDGIDARALGPFFDYYLAFAISAECGVLIRWLAGGMREDVETMARAMTALMFVRPGDLYGKPIDFNVPAYALALATGSATTAPPGARPTPVAATTDDPAPADAATDSRAPGGSTTDSAAAPTGAKPSNQPTH